MSKPVLALEGLSISGNSTQLVQARPVTSGVPRDLPVLDPEDLNIVLVGETGVGKSTFVNAFVNYLNFHSLEEATDSPNIHCVIASKFTISDDNFEEKVVTFEEDENECQKAGASSTQSTRSYRFFINGQHVRLIDTPGIGGTRGIVKDEENFDRLLEALAELKFVHAFCILLKPNNAKLTVLVQYCIKQLLSRLDKTASRNIVFVFTNSRSTFYKPGESLVSVKEILKSIKNSSHVDIPFCKDNVFCIDNEAFRFLLARRHGINFTETEKRDFATSWKKSIDASFRMLSYIAGLAPYEIQDTIPINEVRRLIISLGRPVAMVTKNIDDNLRNIDRQQAQMADKYKIPHPKTVCTHSDCTDIHMVEDSKYVNYKPVCHNHCFLTNVPKQVIGSPELRRCEAMNNDSANPQCLHCHHSFSIHMDIYFDTKNKNVDANIKKEHDIRSNIDATIVDLTRQRESLMMEKLTLQKSIAKFAHFLSHNAMIPYNDTYQEYIQYLIESENILGPNKNENLIRSYKDLIKVHMEQTAILDEQLEQAAKTDPDAKIITAEDVMKLVQELCSLKYCGKMIQDFYVKQQHTRQRENLLHTEKNVDTSGWYGLFKKGSNKIMPKRIQCSRNWHQGRTSCIHYG